MNAQSTIFKTVFGSLVLLAMMLIPVWGWSVGNVVISQIYGAGGNSGATYKYDWIELFNRGTASQSLNGWSVQYASAGGSTWTVQNLPNVTLNPGQYYLIQEAGGANGVVLPVTADLVSTTINMAAAAGKLALCNSITALTGTCPTGSSIIDFVGYGTTASCYEGSSYAPAPSTTAWIIRGSNGYTDTDQNSTDFTTSSTANFHTTANYAEPVTQATNVTFSSILSTSMTVGWTNGGGGNRTVFMKEGAGTITNPVDNTAYSPSADWSSKGTQLGSSGYYCIYNGTGNSVPITNLSPGTTYYVQVFEYNGSVSVLNYFTSTAAGNPNSQVTASPSSPSIVLGSLTSFGSQCINSTYGPNTFTITGTNLTTDNVTVASLSGYTYSTTDPGSYTTSLSLSQVGGSYSQIIYVKFTPTSVQSYDGNIVVGGGGVSPSVNCAASGSGVNTSPTVSTTTPATNLGLTTATCSGNVTAEGCQGVTARGICYSLSANPDITGSKTTETGTTGVFSSNLTNLSSAAIYHYRAYATSTAGTTYGNDYTFATLSPTFLWIEDFETGTKGAYATGDVTCTKGSWNMAEVLIGDLANDRKNGLKSARMKYTSASQYGILTMNFDKSNGAGIVTIYHAIYGTDGNGSWKLQMSLDGGSSWSDVGSPISTTATTLTGQSFMVNLAGNVRFKIVQLSGNTRINIDDFTITDYTVSTTWSGATSNNWALSSNWSNGVPSSVYDVLIPSGLTNYPTLSSPGTCYNISIASGASFLDNSYLTVTGTATVYRYITGASTAWHFLSSPVASQAISGDFTPSGTLPDGSGYDFYAWDETSGTFGTWVNRKNISTAVPPGVAPYFDVVNGGLNFQVCKGYLAEYQSSNPTKQFEGNLNSGAVSYTMSKTGLGTYSGYNLAGNPYPSAIDWKASSGWDRSNLENISGYDMSIWIDGEGNYGSYNSEGFSGTGANGISQYIPVGQGFMVKAASAGTLGMDNGIRVHDNQAWLKSSDEIPNILRMKVTGDANSYSDEIVVEFGHPTAIGGAEKMFSMYETAPSLYTVKPTGNYSIDFRGEPGAVVIPVSFKAGVDGNYALTASQLGSFTSTTVITLEDVKVNKTQNLMQNPVYTFTAGKNDEGARFFLHFGGTFGVNEKANTQPVTIYASGSTVYISNVSGTMLKGGVVVYNMIGQPLISQRLSDNPLTKINFSGRTGYYLIKVVTAENAYSGKVFIN